MEKKNNSSAPAGAPPRQAKPAPKAPPAPGGGERNTSLWRKPLVLAALILATTAAVSLAALVALRAAAANRPVEAADARAACPPPPQFADPKRKDVYEMSAAALLRDVWAAPPEGREKLLIAMHKNHPNAAAMEAVRADYESLPSVRAAIEKEREAANAQARQQKASEALELAIKVAGNDQGKLRKLLGQVVADYKGTPAAEQASRRLQALDDRAKAVKNAQESLKRLAAAKETAKTNMNQALKQMEAIVKEFPGTSGAAQAAKFRDDEMRRREQAAHRREQEQADLKTFPEEFAKFAPGYRNALREGNLDEATQLARQWRAATPNLVAKRVSFTCEADLKLLREINAKVGEYLKDYAQNGEKQGKVLNIATSEGKKLFITVSRVEGGQFMFRPRGGDLLVRAYGAYLAPETRFGFYKEKRASDDKTPPALAHWLLLYAANSPQAEKAWQEAQGQDPRKRDHALMLEHSK